MRVNLVIAALAISQQALGVLVPLSSRDDVSYRVATTCRNIILTSYKGVYIQHYAAGLSAPGPSEA